MVYSTELLITESSSKNYTSICVLDTSGRWSVSASTQDLDNTPTLYNCTGTPVITDNHMYYVCIKRRTDKDISICLCHNEHNKWILSELMEISCVKDTTPEYIFAYLTKIIVVCSGMIGENVERYMVEYNLSTDKWAGANDVYFLPARVDYYQIKVIHDRIFTLTDKGSLWVYDPALSIVVALVQSEKGLFGLDLTNDMPVDSLILESIDDHPVVLALMQSEQRIFGIDLLNRDDHLHELLNERILKAYDISYTHGFKVTFNNGIEDRTILCTNGHDYYVIFITPDRTDIYKVPRIFAGEPYGEIFYSVGRVQL
jgi:hypothetical protein